MSTDLLLAACVSGMTADPGRRSWLVAGRTVVAQAAGNNLEPHPVTGVQGHAEGSATSANSAATTNSCGLSAA